MSDKDDTRGISRRAALAGAAGGVLGGLAPAASAGARPGATRPAGAGPEGGAGRLFPFYGQHQAGVTTPQQEVVCAAAFNVRTGSRAELRDLLRAWPAGSPPRWLRGRDAAGVRA